MIYLLRVKKEKKTGKMCDMKYFVKKRLLTLIKPIANSIFNETNPKGKQLLTRL